jgi:hypothetical protein
MHLTSEQLIDVAEERGSPDALEHIAHCGHCASEVARFRLLLALMRSDDAEPPPPAAAAAVRALLPAEPQRAAPQRRATLRFDSTQAARPLGLRAAASDERQIVFDADPFVIDLRLVPSGHSWQIVGQVLGPDTAGLVELEGPGGVASGELSDLCEFSLPPVPPGSYQLALRLEDRDPVVADLLL